MEELNQILKRNVRVPKTIPTIRNYKEIITVSNIKNHVRCNEMKKLDTLSKCVHVGTNDVHGV